MDNPQHYQPLSHALHPPQAQSSYTAAVYNSKPRPVTNTHREEEEEEEEEEDGDDEGLVEEQLSRHEPDVGSNPSSPPQKSKSATDTRGTRPQLQPQQQQDQNHEDESQEPDRKRRPGRPRGSKNRKPRVGSQGSGKQDTTFYNPAATAAPPQHPDVNAHNQQYYEFQWRVLNLCAEFYGAAEELVKGTPPLVVAQCYQMGPGNKVDPIIMLNEAKRICDTLLANPAQLITNPPPPIYSVAPTLYHPLQTQPVATTSATTTTRTATSPTSKSTTPATVISNPQSFVVSLAPQTNYPHAQYQMYAPPPGQYPTTSYYQYPAYAGTTYYPQPQPVTQTATQSTVQTATATTSAEASGSTGASVIGTIASSSTSSSGLGNQGAWSDEETERLKKLAEDSRTAGSSGEIEWDWVVHQWGNGRTRHQILIKATSLGLKESSTRGLKRRRETDTGGASDAASPSMPNASTVAPSSMTNTTTATHAHTQSTSNTLMNANTVSSNNHSAANTHTHTMSTLIRSPPNSHSQTSSVSTSTPSASPALQHQSRPTVKSNMPWPMPHVAVNTPSPVVPSTTTHTQEQQRTSTTGYQDQQQRPTTATGAPAVAPTTFQDQQRTTSYYRARPTNGDTGAKAGPHSFIYQPNGSAGVTGSSRLKENGK